MPSAYVNSVIPLDPASRWIRIFDLHPGVLGDEEESLHGQLRVVCLDDNPSYSALSYAWGSSSNPRDIVCKTGGSLSVTTNCYDALRQLTHSSRTRSLWVDSICIDQTNEEEKSHEVSLMRDIYGKAEKVYIWLGRGSAHSDYSMDWLANASIDSADMVARIAPFPEFLRPRDLPAVSRMLLREVRMAIPPLRPKKLEIKFDMRAMEDITGRAWFKRVWTVQELVMARDPIVMCGNKSISWDNLQRGIFSAKALLDGKEDAGNLNEVFNSVLVAQSFWLDHHIINEYSEAPIVKWLLRGRSPESSPARMRFVQLMIKQGRNLAWMHYFVIFLIILVRKLCDLRPLNSWGLLLVVFSAIATVAVTPAGVFHGHEQKFRRKLVTLLNRMRTRQATKQVDRVFALHGVLQKFGVPLQAPDYGKSVGKVYHEFARTVIDWQNSLDLLTEASTPALPDTPSWVPDWTTLQPRASRGDSSAARDSPARYHFSDCGRNIHTSGMQVDTVVYCTGLLEDPGGYCFDNDGRSMDPAYLFRCLHNIKVLTRWISYALQISSQSDDASLEKFFETVHSSTGFEDKDKSNLRRIFHKWYGVLTADYSQCHAICPPDIACALAISADETLNLYHRERCRHMAGRRVFLVTSTGLVGTGPPSTEIGDCVVILSGLWSPLILRGVGPHYEVVGAAFIHGVMNGEVWPGDESGLEQMTLV